MAEGSDNEFSAFYSSIDDEQFEAYVEIANAPTAYLVPNTTSLPRQKPTDLFPIKPPNRGPPKIPARPPGLPTPSLPRCKPHPHPRQGTMSLRRHAKPPSPPNKRGDTPLYKIEPLYSDTSVTPIEKGWSIREHNLPHPNKLAQLEPRMTVKGKLQTGMEHFWSEGAGTGSESSTLERNPPERLTGEKYRSLDGEPEENQYASLQPLRTQKIQKLKQKVRAKRRYKRMKEDEIQLEEMSTHHGTDREEAETSAQFSDGSRAVCIVLAIILVALVISIGSLIVAVYTVSSFEHYKGKAQLHTTVVNNNTGQMPQGGSILEVKCYYQSMDEVEDTLNDFKMGRTNDTITDTNFLLGCRVVVAIEEDYQTVSATLIGDEQSVSANSSTPYCLCCLDRTGLVVNTQPQLTCTMTKTTFGLT